MPSSGHRKGRDSVPTPKQAPDDQPTVRHAVATNKLAHKLLKQAQIDNRNQPAGVNVHIGIEEYDLDNTGYTELLLGILEQAKDFGFEYTGTLRCVIILTKL